MAIERDDHITRGFSRLTSTVRQDNTEKFLTLLLQRFQDAEDDFLELANAKSMTSANGVWLDFLGLMFNEARNSDSDEEYRARLLISRSNFAKYPTHDSLTAAVKNFTSARVVSLKPSAIAYGSLLVIGGSNVGGSLYEKVQEIKPAGTKIHIHHDTDDNAFYPAYEQVNIDLESFNVATNGIDYEALELSIDGLIYSIFYLRKDLLSIHESTNKGEQNTLGFEGPAEFQVTSDGTNYENLELVNPQILNKQMKLNAPYLPDLSEQPRPLTWEVEATSK